MLALDALRGVAVLLVLGRHVLGIEDMPAPVMAALRVWRRIGWSGVDLFFVISGFLVSGLLFAEAQADGRVRPWRFLGRRGFKIYPGFYLLLGVSIPWRHASWRQAVHEASFVQNYFSPIWNHTWSLAVEEHFYVFLAVGLFLLARAGRLRAVPALCAALCVVVLLARTASWFAFPATRENQFLLTHLRLDALTFGVLLSWAWSHHRAAMAAWIARRRPWLALASLVFLVPTLVLPLGAPIVNTVGFSLNYLGFGALTLLAAHHRSPNGGTGHNAVLRPLAWIGFRSYSIYLWHMPVYVLASRWLNPTLGHASAIAAYMVGAVALGALAVRLVEAPFLTLRDRVLPRRPAPNAPGTSR